MGSSVARGEKSRSGDGSDWRTAGGELASCKDNFDGFLAFFGLLICGCSWVSFAARASAPVIPDEALLLPDEADELLPLLGAFSSSESASSFCINFSLTESAGVDGDFGAPLDEMTWTASAKPASRESSSAWGASAFSSTSIRSLVCGGGDVDGDVPLPCVSALFELFGLFGLFGLLILLGLNAREE
jgi:hypothetical protein